MRTRIPFNIFFFFSLFLSTQVLFSQIKVDKKSSITYLKANLQVLSSNEFEGRETTTRGENLASLFIASELEKYGVKPYGDDSTYFQNFDLITSGYAIESKISLFDESNSSLGNFLLGDDFFKSGKGLSDSTFCKQSTGIVFASYGITQKENNYDDYAGIDVKGKTVLILSGEPFSDKGNVAGAKQMNLFSNDTKVKLAKEKGAVGVFVIADERLKSYWNRIKEYVSQPITSLQSKDLPAEVKELPVFTVGEKFAEKILSGEKYSYEKLNELLKAKEPIQSFDINKKLKYDIRPFSKTVNSRNVIGLIEGTDPILKKEFIVLSAHFDHLGKHGGVVSHGADDDGSGTVAVLESARILSSNLQNKRSILTVFHTGEEKGLLGSSYAADNSDFISNVVADINMDMVGRESVDSIFCIGSDKLSTEFAYLVQEENSKSVDFVLNYKYDDPNDPNKFYFRSDHYNYAKKGIPVVFFFDDMKVDYHRPTDDVSKINFEKIQKAAELSSNIALHVANLDHKLVVDKKPE
jgi:hypothetical protein